MRLPAGRLALAIVLAAAASACGNGGSAAAQSPFRRQSNPSQETQASVSEWSAPSVDFRLANTRLHSNSASFRSLSAGSVAGVAITFPGLGTDCGVASRSRMYSAIAVARSFHSRWTDACERCRRDG